MRNIIHIFDVRNTFLKERHTKDGNRLGQGQIRDASSHLWAEKLTWSEQDRSNLGWVGGVF